MKAGAILATNTSSISVTKLAAATSRPDKVIGMHFMNPVPLMKLVEIVRGAADRGRDLRDDGAALARAAGQDGDHVEGRARASSSTAC